MRPVHVFIRQYLSTLGIVYLFLFLSICSVNVLKSTLSNTISASDTCSSLLQCQLLTLALLYFTYTLFLFHFILLQRHLQKWLGENQTLIGSGPERLKLSRTADATCALPLRRYSPGAMQPSSCNIIPPTSSASASITRHLYV